MQEGHRPEALIFLHFSQNFFQKVLDIGVKLWYSNQARSRERGERTNLENDTEKKRAKERDSEDSKELKTRKRLKRIKRKSLILAQDERWRRA